MMKYCLLCGEMSRYLPFPDWNTFLVSAYCVFHPDDMYSRCLFSPEQATKQDLLVYIPPVVQAVKWQGQWSRKVLFTHDKYINDMRLCCRVGKQKLFFSFLAVRFQHLMQDKIYFSSGASEQCCRRITGLCGHTWKSREPELLGWRTTMHQNIF